MASSTDNSSPIKKLSPVTRAEEHLYAGLMMASLPSPEPLVMRSILTEARQQGLDPQRLYDLVATPRPPHWPPMPAWEDVAPPE